MSGMTKVTEIIGAHALNGVSYGPFRASKDKPFLEVPTALANALNLPLHESEVQAREEAAQAQASTEDGVEVERLLQANRDLKVDLDEAANKVDLLTQQLHRANDRISHLEGEQAKWEKQRDSLLTDLSDSLKREDALKARLGEAESDTSEDAKPEAAPDEAQASAPEPEAKGTPLPEGTLHRDLLVENDFGTFEKLEAGLVVTEGETESPVQKLDGVGKKTLEAYQRLITEWRKGQAT